MTIHIGIQQAVDLLQQAVSAKGAEHVYEQVPKPLWPGDDTPTHTSCLYTDADSNPSCIVGYALANAGVPIEVLHAIDWGGAVKIKEYDSSGNYIDYESDGITTNYNWEPAESGLDETGINEFEVQHWLRRNDVDIDERAVELLYRAQRQQDNGYSWGDAVTTAVKLVVGDRK